MSKMDSFAGYELADSDLDVVSGGGAGCGRVERSYPVRGGGCHQSANVGVVNNGSVGGNVIAIAGDVIVNGSGSITIIGGDFISA